LNVEKQLAELFKKWSGEEPTKTEKMPAHGSYRTYYRLSGKDKTAIGAHNADRAENVAFLSFSKHFFDTGLPVPQIYGESTENDIYLEEDLGDETLFSFLSNEREKKWFLR